MATKVGIDLGGTWLRIGTLEVESNHQPALDVDAYPSPQNWNDFVELLSLHNSPAVDGFGIAISGPIYGHASVITAPNLPWLNGRNVRDDLERTLGKKIVVANDMEAATEGEMAYGVLANFSWAIFDTISTGWGGNLVLNGYRVDGEPGHANVAFDLPYRCNAGHRGCYESLYSGSAIERKIRTFLPKNAAEDPSDMAWAEFWEAVDGSVQWAVEILDDWAEGVGRAWANTLNRIRPLQAIVYMGTTAENFLAKPRVTSRLRETMRMICMFPEHQSSDFPIIQAGVEHRGVYGAIIVYDKLTGRPNAAHPSQKSKGSRGGGAI